MAIIKCPECGMNVSDKSNMCIHCGYPIAKSQLKKVVRFLPNENKYIIEKDNLTQSEAEQYAKEFNNIFLKYNLHCEIVDSDTQLDCYHAPVSSNIIRCPHCGSTAITTGARGVNWTLGLIGAGKTVNRCGKCGHTWQPK